MRSGLALIVGGAITGWVIALVVQLTSAPTVIMALLTAAIILATLGGVWWLWWKLPKREADRLHLKVRNPKDRAEIEDNFRKTIGQLLGGVAVLIGATLAYLQFIQQQRSAHDVFISVQVSKGFEQLSSSKIIERLGGIYALEGALNASDLYRRPLLEALTAFIRDGTKAAVGASPATDIQAALTVIARRSDYYYDRIDLRAIRAARVNLA